MRNLQAKTLFISVLAVAFPQAADAMVIDSCSYAANQCVIWYEEKIKEDETYSPDMAYEKCPVQGAQPGWRNACGAESQVVLKARLMDVQDQHVITNLPAEMKFMVTAKYGSFGDCKAKWNKQKALKKSKVQFAGFKENEDAEKVCKVPFPSGDHWILTCPILDCADPGPGCKYVEPNLDSKGCPTSCGVKSCNKPVCTQVAPTCAAPPPGCRYGEKANDSHGCPIGCGPLICDK